MASADTCNVVRRPTIRWSGRMRPGLETGSHSQRHSPLWLLRFDGNPVRLGLLRLGKRDAQHAVAALGIDLLFVHLRRERDRAIDASLTTFDVVERLAFLFLLLLMLSTDLQRGAAHFDVDF